MARGFVSVMNAIARDQARRERQSAAEQRRYERELVRAAREEERERKFQDKQNKLFYIESRLDEVLSLNSDLNEQVESLQNILDHTLTVDDMIAFDSLKIHDKFKPDPIPHRIAVARAVPEKHAFESKVKKLSLIETAFRLKGRYEREMQTANEQFETALTEYNKSEQERLARLAEINAKNEKARQAYNHKVEQRNLEVDELRQSYSQGDLPAIITYNAMVLERSEYPEDFPQHFRLAYSPESRELVIEYEFPDVSVIPEFVEYKYVKAKDLIENKARKLSEIKDLYQDIVASTTLRTIHEVYEADQGNHLEVVTLNGFVQTIDPTNGKDIRPCLVSVRTTKDNFLELNLGRVDKKSCLKNLGAVVSSQPYAMQPVKPIIEFDRVDKRFIEQGDVLGEIESRPNLMDLNPTEFETLVSNLFGKMGLETQLTRSSRDGGVDAIVFDPRPILGGKVVIQAKRYKNTVGVSSVRDLYGTMMNEGASKGIIVTTSGYGRDAYEFSKDKPLELIDGGGLLYLLEQVGTQARIVMPVES